MLREASDLLHLLSRPSTSHSWSIACLPEIGLGAGERGIYTVGGWERCICFFQKKSVTLCCRHLWLEAWVALFRCLLGLAVDGQWMGRSDSEMSGNLI